MGVVETYAIENHPMDSRVKLKDDGICETLNARCGTGGGNVPLVLLVLPTESHEVCSYGISRSMLKGGNGSNGGMPVGENFQPTITANGVGAVCYRIEEE